MSKRARKYVIVAVAALVGAIYARLSLGWSGLEFYAGGAVLIILICGVGLPWMEFASDGAFRRRRNT